MNTPQEKATIERVNRALAKQQATQYLRVRTTRGRMAQTQNLGRFYALDTYRNDVVDSCDDLETLQARIMK
jgi:hypothetical protein